MATLTKRTRGGSLMFEIQFCADGRRKTIPLGKNYTEKTARELLEVVEILLHCQKNGIEYPGKKTVGWIESAPGEIQDKLAKAGLIEQPHRKTTGELWTAFRAAKRDIKDSTLEGYDRAEDRFFLFFGRDEPLSGQTQARMEQWKDYLQVDAPCGRSKVPGFAKSTTAGTISKAKAVFNWAVRVGWIEKSPLDGVGRGSFVNEENDRIVTMDEYHRLLDACPCRDWRVIIALARIGGLRAPSEVLRLRWSDINWSSPARFTVTSTKTERYKGKGCRVVPLWDELHVELRELFESESSEGTEFVINRYRAPERTNLGTQFGRIVKLAGIEPIPRPFDNLRMSRSNEVYAEIRSVFGIEVDRPFRKGGEGSLSPSPRGGFRAGRRRKCFGECRKNRRKNHFSCTQQSPSCNFSCCNSRKQAAKSDRSRNAKER